MRNPPTPSKTISKRRTTGFAETRYVGFLTIGHTFTETGVRVDVVREWSLVKAIHRHNEWMKKKNNELLKGVE